MAVGVRGILFLLAILLLLGHSQASCGRVAGSSRGTITISVAQCY